jgi:hypothetical protein
MSDIVSAIGTVVFFGAMATPAWGMIYMTIRDGQDERRREREWRASH